MWPTAENLELEKIQKDQPIDMRQPPVPYYVPGGICGRVLIQYEFSVGGGQVVTTYGDSVHFLHERNFKMGNAATKHEGLVYAGTDPVIKSDGSEALFGLVRVFSLTWQHNVF